MSMIAPIGEQEAPSLSNSYTKREFLPPLLVDTIRVRGPIADYDPSEIRVKKRVNLETGELSELPVGATYQIRDGFHLSVDHLLGTERPQASFEFSVPRYCRGENTSASTLAEVHEAIACFHDDARTFVDWETSWSDLEVRRIDIVEDRVVSDPKAAIHAMAARLGHRAGKTVVHHRADLSGAESLMRGYKTRWTVIAYDKHAEVEAHARSCRDLRTSHLLRSRLNAVKGVVRVETRLRAPVLQGLEDRRVSAIDATWNDRAVAFRTRAGMQTVEERVDIEPRQAILDLFSGPDRARAEAVLGSCLAQALGLPATTDAKTRRRRLQTAERYRVSVEGIVEMLRHRL